MNELGNLVLTGRKTATSSLYKLYRLENEPLPHVDSYSVILNANDKKLCVIRNTSIEIRKFKDVDETFVRKEGDLSLSYRQRVHIDFFNEELAPLGLKFDKDMEIVLEQFSLVYK